MISTASRAYVCNGKNDFAALLNSFLSATVDFQRNTRDDKTARRTGFGRVGDRNRFHAITTARWRKSARKRRGPVQHARCRPDTIDVHGGGLRPWETQSKSPAARLNIMLLLLLQSFYVGRGGSGMSARKSRTARAVAHDDDDDSSGSP